MLKAFLYSSLCLGLLAVCARTSQASIFGLDPDGGGNGFLSVDQLDWTPDSALSLDGLTAIRAWAATAGTVQLPFTTYTHGKLGAANLNNTNQLPGGVGEITFVAGITENVTAAIPTGGGGVIATFGLLPGPVNFFEIWQGAADSNQLAGTGYNNGTLIMSGFATAFQGVANYAENSVVSALDQHNANDYPALQTLEGNGSTTIVGSIAFVDTNYFAGITPGQTISFFSTNQKNPFDAADPSARFTLAPGGAPPVLEGAGLAPAASLGPVNGDINSVFPDVQYQTDAASTFNPTFFVPEPVSVMVWGGLFIAGIVSCARRRHTVVS